MFYYHPGTYQQYVTHTHLALLLLMYWADTLRLRNSSDNRGDSMSSTLHGSSVTRNHKLLPKNTSKEFTCISTGKAHGANAKRAISDLNTDIFRKIERFLLPLLLLDCTLLIIVFIRLHSFIPLSS